MAESLGTKAEQTNESDNKKRFDSLTSLNSNFNPERARQLIAESKETHNEKTEKAGEENTPEQQTKLDTAETKITKPVEELTEQEAASEYLDILLQLSQNFTSAEGKSSRAASYDDEGNLVARQTGYDGEERRIVGRLYEKATGVEHRKARHETYDFETHGYSDAYLDRELSIDMADKIIAAESEWRRSGDLANDEAYMEKIYTQDEDRRQANLELSKITSGPLGGLKEKLYAIFRRDKYDNLVRRAHSQGLPTPQRIAEQANAKLQTALEEAYSPDYGYGHHRLSYTHEHDQAYVKKTNEQYNDQFFTKEREQLIDRAIELRRKLQ